MKRERSEIRLLLGILLAFSSIIGVLHGRVTVQSEEPAAVEMPDLQKIIERILPFIQSQSVEATVAALRDLPVQQARALFLQIIDDDLLEPQDVLLLVGGVSTQYAQSDDKEKLFSILLEKPVLQKGSSPLYVIAQSIYAKEATSALFAWITQQQDKHPWLVDSYKKSLEEALARHNVTVLKHLDAYAKKLTPSQLFDLLWIAAGDDKNNDIVRFLLQKQAAVNNDHEGLTPLMRAVLGANLPGIQLLITAGADINKIVKPEIGSALQLLVSMQQKEKNKNRLKLLLDIEDYLRARGAREVLT